MRKLLGRLALLLGVLLVAAAAWWGATTLLDEDEDEDEASEPDPACTEAPRRTDAADAERAFIKKYGDRPWFRDASIKRTDEGFVLLVTVRKKPPVPDLPTCPSDVPLVLRGGQPTTG